MKICPGRSRVFPCRRTGRQTHRQDETESLFPRSCECA